MIPPEKLERRNKRWEIKKNIVEIIAIAIGGGWALFNFGLKDLPAIALRRKAESTLTWSHKRKDYVHAEFNVTLTNAGSSSFKLTRARLRTWTLENVYVPSQSRLYLDANQIIKDGTPIFTKDFIYSGRESDTFLGSPYIQEYEEGAVWTENFDFTFKRDPSKLVLFCMQFYKNKCDTAFDWTYAWDPIGGEDSSHENIAKH